MSKRKQHESQYKRGLRLAWSRLRRIRREIERVPPEEWLGDGEREFLYAKVKEIRQLADHPTKSKRSRHLPCSSDA